jgi:hypothetical protein
MAFALSVLFGGVWVFLAYTGFQWGRDDQKAALESCSAKGKSDLADELAQIKRTVATLEGRLNASGGMSERL